MFTLFFALADLDWPHFWIWFGIIAAIVVLFISLAIILAFVKPRKK
jgi:hypothetical protein